MSPNSGRAGATPRTGPIPQNPTPADHEAGGSRGDTLPPVSVDDWVRAVESTDGVFVAIVRRAADDTVWRRAFFTLDAARNLADRARARGDAVSILVAELRPAAHLPALIAEPDDHSSPEPGKALFTGPAPISGREIGGDPT